MITYSQACNLNLYATLYLKLKGGTMKKILLSGSICLTIGMISCGGSSRGLSADIPVFNTVTISVVKAEPSPLNSDVLVRLTLPAQVRSEQSTGCSTTVRADDVCIGIDYTTDNLTLTFKSETIKNAQGLPVTPNPSSVLVEKYRVSFTGCIPGVYEFPVNQMVLPDTETAVGIQPITQDMKRAMVQPAQYTYIGQDGCPTTFNAIDYPSLCSAVANFEFSTLELNSGIRRTIKYSIAVRFADFSDQDQCTIR